MATLAIAPTDPETPDARACLAAYAALLAAKIPGITATHVPVPDPEADHYRPPQGAFLLARSDGLPLACVSLKRIDTRPARSSASGSPPPPAASASPGA